MVCLLYTSSKNPPHTGRVKELVKMFPNAKFIYLMRNPYTVFESTCSFFTNTIQPLKLQDITPAELEQNIDVYKRQPPFRGCRCWD